MQFFPFLSDLHSLYSFSLSSFSYPLLLFVMAYSEKQMQFFPFLSDLHSLYSFSLSSFSHPFAILRKQMQFFPFLFLYSFLFLHFVSPLLFVYSENKCNSFFCFRIPLFFSLSSFCRIPLLLFVMAYSANILSDLHSLYSFLFLHFRIPFFSICNGVYERNKCNSFHFCLIYIPSILFSFFIFASLFICNGVYEKQMQFFPFLSDLHSLYSFSLSSFSHPLLLFVMAYSEKQMQFFPFLSDLHSLYSFSLSSFSHPLLLFVMAYMANAILSIFCLIYIPSILFSFFISYPLLLFVMAYSEKQMQFFPFCLIYIPLFFSLSSFSHPPFAILRNKFLSILSDLPLFSFFIFVSRYLLWRIVKQIQFFPFLSDLHSSILFFLSSFSHPLLLFVMAYSEKKCNSFHFCLIYIPSILFSFFIFASPFAILRNKCNSFHFCLIYIPSILFLFLHFASPFAILRKQMQFFPFLSDLHSLFLFSHLFCLYFIPFFLFVIYIYSEKQNAILSIFCLIFSSLYSFLFLHFRILLLFVMAYSEKQMQFFPFCLIYIPSILFLFLHFRIPFAICLRIVMAILSIVRNKFFFLSIFPSDLHSSILFFVFTFPHFSIPPFAICNGVYFLKFYSFHFSSDLHSLYSFSLSSFSHPFLLFVMAYSEKQMQFFPFCLIYIPSILFLFLHFRIPFCYFEKQIQFFPFCLIYIPLYSFSFFSSPFAFVLLFVMAYSFLFLHFASPLRNKCNSFHFLSDLHSSILFSFFIFVSPFAICNGV
ncbi:unnamed protein product [Acanthosepion pharaonis]|uniref:Uncharacterized protein n=1 Tax=Acanthosepion pharaonis TaxID=158019 RepID=A0A812C4V1_ACAPH|nr:unnamed protein product [Sepia pharaonis]